MLEFDEKSHSLGQSYGSEGCGWCSLPHTGVATNHGDGSVPARYSHGEVKRRDDANATQWVPVFHQCMTRSYDYKGNSIHAASPSHAWPG